MISKQYVYPAQFENEDSIKGNKSRHGVMA